MLHICPCRFTVPTVTLHGFFLVPPFTLSSNPYGEHRNSQQLLSRTARGNVPTRGHVLLV